VAVIIFWIESEMLQVQPERSIRSLLSNLIPLHYQGKQPEAIEIKEKAGRSRSASCQL
jgi:hypothetical protein